MARRLILASATVLVACTAFLAAVSQAGQRIAPTFSARAFPVTGQAKGALASRLYIVARAQAEDPDLPPSRAQVRLARQAYTREPQDVGAIFVLARELSLRDADRGLAVIQRAHELSRRSSAVNADLLAAYARTGQDGDALLVFDEILRRQTAMHGSILALMANGVGNEGLHPAVLDLLSARPPWGDQFWRQLAQSPEGLTRAATLRLAHARQGGKVDPEVDRLLIAGLADNGHFDDAHTLAGRLFPASGLARGANANALRNGDFAAKPDFLPFDWQLTSTGDYGGAVQTQRGDLVISALGGSRGKVAEQLVRLTGTNMMFASDVQTQLGSASKRALRFEIACADGPRKDEVLFSGAPSSATAIVSTVGCRWAWFRILVEVPSEAEGFEWTVGELRLVPRQV